MYEVDELRKGFNERSYYEETLLIAYLSAMRSKFPHEPLIDGKRVSSLIIRMNSDLHEGSIMIHDLICQIPETAGNYCFKF